MYSSKRTNVYPFSIETCTYCYSKPTSHRSWWHDSKFPLGTNLPHICSCRLGLFWLKMIWGSHFLWMAISSTMVSSVRAPWVFNEHAPFRKSLGQWRPFKHPGWTTHEETKLWRVFWGCPSLGPNSAWEHCHLSSYGKIKWSLGFKWVFFGISVTYKRMISKTRM